MRLAPPCSRSRFNRTNKSSMKRYDIGMAYRGTVLLGLAASSASMAATIPCEHRYAQTKVLDIFNYVQEKPQVRTGIKAVRLNDLKEVREARSGEFNMLVRYCRGILDLDNGERVPVVFRVASRDSYKAQRAEDVQACWD